MELLIGERALIARLTFPDEGSFVASPRCKMPVQTVVRDVELATHEPFRVRRRPLQNRVPLLKPMKLLRHSCPKVFRVSTRLRTQPLQFRHRFDMGFLREGCRRRKQPVFLLQGFDVGRGC